MSFSEIIIFHYHLRKGGVTDVIVLSIQAIRDRLPGDIKLTLAIGNSANLDEVKNRLEPPSYQGKKTTIRLVPQLDYLENQQQVTGSRELYLLLNKEFGGAGKLWWVHNFHLGKNPVFTQSLLTAAQANQPILFQIHDFPECARYENLKFLKHYISQNLYPTGDNIRYGLINPRDSKLLVQAGIPQEEVFLLENPVPLQPVAQKNPKSIKEAMEQSWTRDFPGFKKDAFLLLYPVRSIRRKNVLEAGLLVELMDRPANLLITLPGISESEWNYSQRTEEAFRKGWISGACAVGSREETPWLNYENFWAASDMIISSSIQEGFGYLYLNSLHWQKPLTARKLDIMESFLPLFPQESLCLYQNLSVPLSNAQEASLLKAYREKLSGLSGHIGKAGADKIYNEIQHKLLQKELGFSYFSMDLQLEILEQIHNDGSYRAQCRGRNLRVLKEMEDLLDRKVENCDGAIESSYGAESYFQSLKKILDSYIPHGTYRKNETMEVQQFLIDHFTTLPYLRLLY